MSSTGPVGISDKIMRKSVCVYMRVTVAQYQTGRLWNPVVCILELSHDQHRTGGIGDRIMRKSVFLRGQLASTGPVGSDTLCMFICDVT